MLVENLGNNVDVVKSLLENKNNVKELEKDGWKELNIEWKEGYNEIDVELINVGEYINIKDSEGDNKIINDVKGGKRGVVEELIKKYEDVEIKGKERKKEM